MQKKAIVLGCGLVGATMARDMAADDGFDVTLADVSEDNLRRVASTAKVKTLRTDLSGAASVANAIASFDVVLGALPSRFGYQTLRTVIECGKPYADISFMPENALEHDALAKKKNVTAVVDCGVSPGLSNLFVGHAYASLDETETAEIYVGGLPKQRIWPYQYKAPFAPSDVLEEYTRPARLVEHGRQVTRPALSEPELMDFDTIGTLEAFNTDGLRSLLQTMPIPNMKEKTLRYPGHIELMRVLRETGFFDKTPIDVKGVQIRPLDFTSKLLFPRWTFAPGEEEFTVLRVLVTGRKAGDRVKYVYEIHDEFDRTSGSSSMARTTAYPCTIVARMLARGEIKELGVVPPEYLARIPRVFDQIVNELARRGVKVRATIERQAL